jgi:hypothetical protein
MVYSVLRKLISKLFKKGKKKHKDFILLCQDEIPNCRIAKLQRLLFGIEIIVPLVLKVPIVPKIPKASALKI